METPALALRKQVPQLLRDERHEGVEQVQRRFKNARQVDPRGRNLLAFRRAGDFRLDPFHVPIAELVPEEVIDLERRLVEAVIRQSLFHFAGHGREAGEYPAIRERQMLGRSHGLKTQAGNRFQRLRQLAALALSGIFWRFIRMKRPAFQILLAKAR